MRLRAARPAAVRAFAAQAKKQAPRMSASVTVATGLTTAAVLAYTQMDQVHCDWLSWLGFGGSVKKDEFADIRAEIAKIIGDNAAGPIFVRLAWHAAGTYDINTSTGGSNGATMRFAPECNHGANAGLGLARKLLEPVKAAHPEISYADLWTLAGVVAIEVAGGPKVGWHSGRTDAASGESCPPDGRLPDASKTQDHIRNVFYRMGFNDQEIVALLGAHTLGECHRDRSGYVGPWTRDPHGFDNSYFTLLLDEKWQVKAGMPLQFEDKTGDLMMLPADLALVVDPEFRKYVELYAKDGNKFNQDFAKAFEKLLHLGVPTKKN